ncbi:MAG TPA: GNAT family N-acetyltransferase [Gaiellaceae bacterium]|nr:GNAT family N-acetyltransferase [Gaiellaceae bacterium]
MSRNATPDDLPVLEELWRAFVAEVPDAPWRDDDTEEDVGDLARRVDDDVVVLDDDAGGVVIGTMLGARRGFVDLVYVRPEARGRGVARRLVAEATRQLRERGAEHVELEVLASNERARALYERWGFRPVELTLAAPVAQLLDDDTAHGPTFGTVHVQTDDAGAVSRAAEKILPRLGRSRELRVSETRNGWISVRAAVADPDPAVLRRLARELSYANGGVALALGVERGANVHYTLYDRGSAVDEYASLPEFHGPLPPGDVIALGANPTVVARLTGADPTRVREVARTASSPADLPPWNELYVQLAELMGVEADADPV